MRGPIRIIMAAAVAVCMFAFTAASAFGDGDDELFNTSAVGGVLLRDVTVVPKGQPAAGEFVNNGNVELAGVAGFETPIICKSVEFGTTVLKAVAPVELAIPWGVAEGDLCTSKAGGLVVKVPTYFDTLANGAVGSGTEVASVSIADGGAGTEIVATLHNLHFSQQVGVKFCDGNLNLLKGDVFNVTTGFMEETTPNLNVQFTNVTVPIANGEGSTGCPTEGKLTANFFLETMSAATDTSFFKT
jgi:hypothetical protein